TVKEMLNLVDYVMVMTVNPGFAGQKFIEFTKKKLAKLAAMKEECGFKLVIDGACSPAVIKECSEMGVDGFVLGTSAIFGKEQSYKDIVKKLRSL
ncbi:MAG: ribulose phosphate epimerase, partial [Erysipelotrichaceae bacterium]|nr:ribulose phosphate epimerase [Erysipelotrichaceae bacterium]